MRPIRTYAFTFTYLLDDPETPPVMEFPMPGPTPCAARGKAWTELEKRLRQQNWPRTGWKLTAQRMIPLQGATLRG